MTINPILANGHKHIIVAVDYFTKWTEAMPTFDCKAETATHFFFNHVITWFGVPKQLVSDHGAHFQDTVWAELSTMLKFEQRYSSSYYPQGNGQVEAVNKIIKTMLQRMVGNHKTNWNHMLFSTLWAYRTSTKTATSFTPFCLVHGVESMLPIECQIPSLHLMVELLPDTSPLE